MAGAPMLLLALVSGAGRSSAQEVEAAAPSGGTARTLSLVSTALGVAAGTALWATAEGPSSGDVEEDPERAGPAMVIAGGLVVGPAVGYLYGGRTGRGLKTLGMRAGLVLLSFLPAYAICGWDCTRGDDEYDLAWMVVATGSGLAMASAIYDIVRVKGEVEKRQRTVVGLTPVYLGSARAPGLALRMSF